MATTRASRLSRAATSRSIERGTELGDTAETADEAAGSRPRRAHRVRLGPCPRTTFQASSSGSAHASRQSCVGGPRLRWADGDDRRIGQPIVGPRVTAGSPASLPGPDDFAAPPSADDRARWAATDRAARPDRLGRLRDRLATAGLDAYFGIRPEHARYLTGFALGDGEDRVAGSSAGSSWVARRSCCSPTAATASRPDARHRMSGSSRSTATSRRAGPSCSHPSARDAWGRAGAVSHGTWTRLAAAAPAPSWSRSTAGSRRTARSRSPPRSSGSRPPAPSPTVRSRRSCPRSAPE